MTPTRPLLEVSDLHVHFRAGTGFFSSSKSTIAAVDGISLSIMPGETFGLVGESGCGKTSFGRAVLRLGEVTSGRIVFDGADITAMAPGELRRTRRRMQMIFQDPYASLDPRMTVHEIVAEPIRTHDLAKGNAIQPMVAELLRLVGLDPRRSGQYPHAFSGGQRQRIGIARALAVRPDFLVCDEATSALDVSIRAQVLNLLADLRRRYGLSFLFISHDLGVVRHMSDRIGVMYLGKLVEVGPVSAVFERSLHPYTHALLSAVPLPDPALERTRRRIILKGDLPNPAKPPDGCRFHSRCWLWETLGRPNRCRTEPPTLADLGAGHLAACHFTKEAEAARPQAASTIRPPARRIRQRDPGRFTMARRS